MEDWKLEWWTGGPTERLMCLRFCIIYLGQYLMLLLTSLLDNVGIDCVLYVVHLCFLLLPL